MWYNYKRTYVPEVEDGRTKKAMVGADRRSETYLS